MKSRVETLNRVKLSAACPGLSGCADQRPDSSGRNRKTVPALHGPGLSQRDNFHQLLRFMGGLKAPSPKIPP
jgi:hypothetical protein